MNKGTKIVLGVVGAAAVGTGVYFLIKALGSGNSAYGQSNLLTPPVVPGVTPAPAPVTPSAPSTTKPANIDTLAFQKYVLEVQKDSSILGSYGADGQWGSRTQAAWDKYGLKYVAWKSGVNPDAATQAATDAIGSGKDQAKKTHGDQWYLSKADAIYKALEGWDDDEDAIKSVAMNLHTNADYYALQNAFGKKSYYGATYDLKSWMKADMYDWEIERYFNKPMAANGVTVKLQYS
jgi:hypothetical protein